MQCTVHGLRTVCVQWIQNKVPFVADHNVEGNKGTSSGDEGATLSERTAHKSASTGLTDII